MMTQQTAPPRDNGVAATGSRHSCRSDARTADTESRVEGSVVWGKGAARPRHRPVMGGGTLMTGPCCCRAPASIRRGL